MSKYAPSSSLGSVGLNLGHYPLNQRTHVREPGNMAGEKKLGNAFTHTKREEREGGEIRWYYPDAAYIIHNIRYGCLCRKGCPFRGSREPRSVCIDLVTPNASRRISTAYTFPLQYAPLTFSFILLGL
jgi:hypothetical protein